jgi:hypothetical protein
MQHRRLDRALAVLADLCGSVLHSALMRGQMPSDEVIAATVDVMLRGLDPRSSAAARKERRARGAEAVDVRLE